MLLDGLDSRAYRQKGYWSTMNNALLNKVFGRTGVVSTFKKEADGGVTYKGKILGTAVPKGLDAASFAKAAEATGLTITATATDDADGMTFSKKIPVLEGKEASNVVLALRADARDEKPGKGAEEPAAEFAKA